MRDRTLCVACGDDASGQHGLAVDDAGELVANDYAGEWAGVAACEACYTFHRDHGPAALLAHLAALTKLRALLGRAFRAWNANAEGDDELRVLAELRPFDRWTDEPASH